MHASSSYERMKLYKGNTIKSPADTIIPTAAEASIQFEKQNNKAMHNMSRI